MSGTDRGPLVFEKISGWEESRCVGWEARPIGAHSILKGAKRYSLRMLNAKK